MAKPKRYRHLQRSGGGRRPPHDRILIVCEGEKSERLYLEDLKRALRLPAVDIIGRGAGPAAVWKRAQEAFARDPDYDQIFCVFDRDTHEDYAQVLADIGRHRELGRIGKRKLSGTQLAAIPSDPCFEFWLLLHFGLTTASFAGPADVTSRLRRCAGMAEYSKATPGVFSLLRDRLDAAIANARWVREELHRHGADGPVTQMDEMLEYLLEQSRRHQR